MTATHTLPPPGEFKTTQEIRDAQLAQRLGRRRSRMLWWSLPVVLLAFLVALKLLSATLINTVGINAYQNQNHNTAADRFSMLEFANVVERWKPHFNRGTAIYASGDFFAATVPLQRALDLVPKEPPGEPRGEPECAVRTNFSLALEGLGDESLAAGDPDTALDYYDRAQEMLADCGSGGGGGEQAEEAEERQQERQDQAQEQQEQQGGEGQEEEEQGGEGQEEEEQGGEGQEEEEQGGEGQEEEEQNGEGQEEEEQNGEGQEEEEEQGGDPREEELEERNREAQEQREEEERRQGGGDGSGQNW